MGRRDIIAADGGRVTRRGLFSIVAGCLVAAYARPARADLFGGDIGVLLAQLQQQLTLVSNAIQTVRGIYASVERLQRTYEETKKFASNITGSGGLEGFLRGTQGLVDAGRGAVGNLQYLNVAGGNWKDLIVSQHGALTFEQAIKLTKAASQFDQMMLRDAGRFTDAFGQVTQSFDGLRSATQAARDAESVLGVVGQTKLLNRQFVQLVGISAQLSGTMSTTGSMIAAKYQAEAAEREASRVKAKEHWDSIKTSVEVGPVEIRYNPDGEWK